MSKIQSSDEVQVVIQQNGTEVRVQVIQQHLNLIRSPPPYFTVAEPMLVPSHSTLIMSYFTIESHNGTTDGSNPLGISVFMDDSEDHPTHQIRSVSVSSLNVSTSAPSYAVDLPGNDSIVIRNPTSLRPSLTNETGVFRTDVDAPTSTPHQNEHYQRHDVNTSPRTDYNDILKNIRFKMPKLLPNEFSFVQPFKMVHFHGSDRIEKPVQETQPCFLSLTV